MDRKTYRNYFTAGEFASLFGISKQALLYYDKIGLLSPNFIGENGYRHYSMPQYLDLEIIVNMRILGIGIAAIKEYLKNRSRENFLKIMNDKKQECEKILAETEKTYRSLENISTSVSKKTSVILDQIFLQQKKERLLRLTEVYDTDNGKVRIKKFAKHSQKTFHSRGILEKNVGWIVSRENFFNKTGFVSSKAYFSYAPDVPGHKKVEKYVLPAGSYLSIYFKGTFYQNAARLIEKISNFMEINNLEPASDVFILPMENHWFFHSSEDYLTKLFLQVTAR